MVECRLLVDRAGLGPWNMAVDELLWDWSGQTGRCALRVYHWAEPTLSLGYFQPYEDRYQHEASQGCAVVRRLSGGGAIVHDAELTYALALPADHPAAPARLRLYQSVHEAIVATLAELGIDASLGSAHLPDKAATQPFLCFQRRGPGDIVVGPVKVGGSAQRRNRMAILQHGSVLLARSPAAPELPGLAEIAGYRCEAEAIIARWLPRLAQCLSLHFTEQPLSLAERHRAAQLAALRYASEDWTRNRKHPTQKSLKPFDFIGPTG